MDIDTFNIMYAETMMYYQIIEHDVKFIFAYMRKGNLNDNFNDIETTTLGQMIRKLEKLDYSDNKPLACYINVFNHEKGVYYLEELKKLD